MKNVTLALSVALLLGWGLCAEARAQTKETKVEVQKAAVVYQGETRLPTLFAFRCDIHTSDPTIRDCPQNPAYDPYGGGAGKQVHWTHSWVQVHNGTGHTFDVGAGDQVRLYLYGENGQPVSANTTYCRYPLYTDPATGGVFLDLLSDAAPGMLPKNGTAFIFVEQCLNDGSPVAPDQNPPTSGLLVFKKNLSAYSVTNMELQVHAGWEEGVSSTLYGRWYYEAKAGTLIDKERVSLKP